MVLMSRSNKDRFFPKVYQTEYCWFWLAYCTSDGYGRFRYNGIWMEAHRASYIMFRGPIPEGLEIDHLCRVRKCVNPEHLEIVTHIENMQRGNRFDIGKLNRVKTHCPQGHLYSMVDAAGARRCRSCHNITSRKSAERRKNESR